MQKPFGFKLNITDTNTVRLTVDFFLNRYFDITHRLYKHSIIISDVQCTTYLNHFNCNQHTELNMTAVQC